MARREPILAVTLTAILSLFGCPADENESPTNENGDLALDQNAVDTRETTFSDSDHQEIVDTQDQTQTDSDFSCETRPEGTIAVALHVDDNPNRTFDDGELVWEGQFGFDLESHTITPAPDGTMASIALYDDGPLDSDGHEPCWAEARDGLFETVVFVAPDPEQSLTFNYSVTAGGSGAVWAEQHPVDGSFVVHPSANPDPIQAAGLAIAREGGGHAEQSSGPAWADDAVVYEVFVRSWYDSDGDGIGDIQGLIETLDYLSDGDPETDEDLGVDAIWLMPIFDSPSYHGYDTVDYEQVNPDYGSNEDFEALFAAASERGIRLILDFVVAHSSNQHPFFQDAYGNPTSLYDDWYEFTNDANTQYESFFGFSNLPSLNHASTELRSYLVGIADRWSASSDDPQSLGATAFRCDYAIGPSHDFWRTLRSHMHSRTNDFLMIGELWLNPGETSEAITYERLAAYYDGEFDMAFDFPLFHALTGADGSGRATGSGLLDPSSEAPATGIETALRRIDLELPAGAQRLIVTGNHDTDRIASLLGDGETGARLAAILKLTLPGTPLIYYGEEIGMRGTKGEGQSLPGYSGPVWDESRREPMDWNTDESGQGMTMWYRPEGRNNIASDGISVEEQRGVDGSLWELYRQLIDLRRTLPSLRATHDQQNPTRFPLNGGSSHVYSYLRHNGVDDPVLVVLNLGATTGTYELSTTASILSFADGTYELEEMLTGESATSLTVDGGAFSGFRPIEELEGRTGAVFVLRGR